LRVVLGLQGPLDDHQPSGLAPSVWLMLETGGLGVSADVSPFTQLIDPGHQGICPNETNARQPPRECTLTY
jgi:hypothetical protein